MPNKMERRDFLKMTGAAAVAALSQTASAQQSVKPVRLGFIGIGSRGTYLLNLALGLEGVEVPAICDINQSHLDRAIGIVEKAQGKRPAGFSAGSYDYRRLLQRDDVDAVLIATPMQWHGVMSVDALRAKKHVLSEIAAASSPQKGIKRYVDKRFKPDTVAAKTKFAVGDTTTCLIRTAKGALIDLRFDIYSARPHRSTTYFSLQGTTASYEDREGRQEIWIEGKSKGYDWEPAANYAEAYEHPLWKRSSEQAQKTGHSGGDYFVIAEFLDTLRSGRPSPIDVYDAAAWSCIVPLSAASIRAGGAPQEIPDFTRGKWEKRK